MKKTLLCATILLLTNLVHAQQKGQGSIIDIEKKQTTYFQWEKYYDNEKDSAYSTTYLFMAKGMRMGYIITHNKRTGEIWYMWKYRTKYSDAYIASEGSYPISDFKETNNGSLTLIGEDCESCNPFEIKFVSSKQEHIKVLKAMNLFANMILKLDAN